MNRRDYWSADDETRLRDLVRKRVPVAQIATELGRTEAAVAMRKNRLGLRSNALLPKADVAEIERLFEVGIPVKSIARRIGVRPGKIVHAIRENGLLNARSYSVGGDLPWDDEIRRLSSDGMRVADIARIVGQSRARVRARLVTLARRDALAESRATRPSNRRMDVGIECSL